VDATGFQSRHAKYNEEKIDMKLSLFAVRAAALSLLFVSSTALAFCFKEDPFIPNVNGIDTVSCTAQGDSGNNLVDQGVGFNYSYTVTASGAESSAGGVLLDITASVVSGTGGPCNKSFSVVGSGVRTFSCNNANNVVQFIRVFVE
jgi:hypothetical protein